MAEGGKLQLAVESFNCTICFESYKEPKILPCSHTFCLGCLEKTLKMKEERARALKPQRQEVEPDGESELREEDVLQLRQSQTINCPVCKREHAVPLEGLTGLPVDLEAQQAIDFEHLHKSLTKTKMSQKCGSCSKERPIPSHCDECGGICQNCTEAHKEYVVFAKHRVVPVEDLSSENVGVKKKAHLCSRHNETVIMYCDSCSQVICHHCIVKLHQGHSLSLLEEADEKLREKVRQQKQAVQKTKKVFEGYREYIAGVEGEVVGESYNEKLKEKVNREFNKRIRRLQEKRESLVDYIDGYDATSKKMVWAEKGTVDLVLNKIQAGLKMTEKAQKCVSPADRIAMNSQGSAILEEVSKMTWSHESLPHPLVFQSGFDLKQLSFDGGEGSVDLAPITDKDISVGAVDENGRKLNSPKIGEPTIIEVTFKVGLVEEPRFQILYGKSRKILESVAAYEIAESKSWNIEFVPRCAGKHLVQVWVGGLAVAVKDDVTITGTLRQGSKVQPGPDWTPPDDKLLYFVGTVTSALSSTVEVEWTQDGSCVEERQTPSLLLPNLDTERKGLPQLHPRVFELDAEEDESAVLSFEPAVTVDKHFSFEDNDTVRTTLDAPEAEEEDTLLTEEDEPKPKHVIKRHKWGGWNDVYEVELVL